MAKEYRAKTELRKLAVVSVERDVSALRSPSAANRRNEDEQLTKQVQHLFTEKVMLQARLKELERENQHLSDEVEMLHTQVVACFALLLSALPLRSHVVRFLKCSC